MRLQKIESGVKDTAGTKEQEAKLSASTSFRLFGKTVLLADLWKDSPSVAQDSKTLKTDEGPLVKLSPDQLDTNLSLGGFVSNCSPLAGTAPINQMEQQKESSSVVKADAPMQSSSVVKADAPMLWWSLYQVPYHYLGPYNPSIDQEPPSPCGEEKLEVNEVQKERSCTDSNEGSASGVETLGDKNVEAVDSFSQKPYSKGSVEPCNSRRGFVPYKRCLAEREDASSTTISNDRERQKIRVC